ncbi:MAG: PAS domain-containing protein [Planctomycetales bacterium]|nr:PAS domain-containing protein [Planctomycetales bacterium]
MFHEGPAGPENKLRMAILAVFGLSIAALAVTVWVMIDFLAEQKIVAELIEALPADSKQKAENLQGELKWQFRLSTLIVLNMVVTGFAFALLSRAYRTSQASLRDVKAQAADILGSMDLGIITTDTKGIVTSINRRGQSLLAVNRNVIDQPLSDVQTFELDEFRQHAIASTHRLTRDFTVLNDRTRRILRAFCQPLQDYKRREIGNIIQIHDITERKLIDDQLRRMERYMGLGSLVAGLHHEIKNPLAALSLHIQLLEEQLDETDASEAMLHNMTVIKTEIVRIGGVLERFRDFASTDELNIRPVDLEQLVGQQVALLSPRAQQQGIVILVQVDGAHPVVEADPGRIEQVLLNLLLNAMEAMPKGGQLTITISGQAETAHIELADTGCGIPRDLIDKIMDPYFTTKSSGTGLGLSLCDKILRQHHGNLDFETSPQGSTFTMTLPVDHDYAARGKLYVS